MVEWTRRRMVRGSLRLLPPGTAVRYVAAGNAAFGNQDVRVIPVSGLSTGEGMEYLTAWLGDGLGPRFEARDLIEGRLVVLVR